MGNIYCKFLTNCLSFHQKNVRFCTTLQLGEIVSVYQENPKELADKICELRRQIKDNLLSNIVPKGCQNCIYRSSEKTYNDKIQRIDLYYWYHCNCGCFYCSYRDETKGEFSDKIIYGNSKIYQIIKELYKLNQIDLNNLYVNVGGGDIGVLKEFPKLVDLFLKHNLNFSTCESSGIRYLKPVEKLLKKGKGAITVAVCTGNRDIYKKIKRRDKYLQVMKNLKRYVLAAKKYKGNIHNADNVVSKYIILKGFNDNIEEVEKWLLESKKYGLTCVEISMEFCWGIHTKKGQKIENYNYEIFDYVEKRTKELGLLLKKNTTSIELMQQGTY